MNWSDISGVVGKTAPLLGTLLGGPAGAAIGGIIASALGTSNSPEDVSAILANPDAAVKLKQIESDRQTALAALAEHQASSDIAAAVQAAQAVNTTMQAESASEHWPSYSWRPTLGFAVAFNTVASSILALGVFVAVVLGMPQAQLAVSQLPTVLGSLAAISGVVLPILGIASWYRGKAQADPNIQTDNRG